MNDSEQDDPQSGQPAQPNDGSQPKLTAHQKRQLEMIAGKFFHRVPNGYRQPGTSSSITLNAMRKLEAAGFIRRRFLSGRDTITLTTKGRNAIGN